MHVFDHLLSWQKQFPFPSPGFLNGVPWPAATTLVFSNDLGGRGEAMSRGVEDRKAGKAPVCLMPFNICCFVEVLLISHSIIINASFNLPIQHTITRVYNISIRAIRHDTIGAIHSTATTPPRKRTSVWTPIAQTARTKLFIHPTGERAVHTRGDLRISSRGMDGLSGVSMRCHQ